MWVNIRTDSSGTVSIIDAENTSEESPIIQDKPIVSSVNQNIIVLLGVLAIVGVVVTVIIMKKKPSGTSKVIEDSNSQDI